MPGFSDIKNVCHILHPPARFLHKQVKLLHWEVDANTGSSIVGEGYNAMLLPCLEEGWVHAHTLPFPTEDLVGNFGVICCHVDVIQGGEDSVNVIDVELIHCPLELQPNRPKS